MTLKQVHDKFKIFTGPLAADMSIGAVAEQVSAFVRDHKVAAKSIGVEYLESAKKLMVTLGYTESGETYPVKVTSVNLGKIGGLESGDVSRLETAMASAAAKVGKTICHELYITDDGDFLMVFMSHGA